jgi:hypothetical protein
MDVKPLLLQLTVYRLDRFSEDLWSVLYWQLRR